jgi:hypothetical protein
VIPFAFLINNQRDTVLSLLEPMNINGRTALDILLQTWCENAETFQGFWPSRVSTLALTQLLVSDRPSIQNLVVKGDIIINPNTKNSEYFHLRFVWPLDTYVGSHYDAFKNEDQYAYLHRNLSVGL